MQPQSTSFANELIDAGNLYEGGLRESLQEWIDANNEDAAKIVAGCLWKTPKYTRVRLIFADGSILEARDRELLDTIDLSIWTFDPAGRLTEYGTPQGYAALCRRFSGDPDQHVVVG